MRPTVLLIVLALAACTNVPANETSQPSAAAAYCTEHPTDAICQK